jgi:hypothetical protein
MGAASDYSAIDALFEGRGCEHVYLDVGTNIGVQLRKLYEPHRYKDAPVLGIFKDMFGAARQRCGVCSVGIEPNPRHGDRLDEVQRQLTSIGARVAILKAAASDAEGTTTLNTGIDDFKWNDLGASVAGWALPTQPGAATVRTLDLSRVIHRLHRRLQEQHGLNRGASRLVMKLDIEGLEYRVAPHLILTQAFCMIDLIFMEQHPRVFNQLPSNAASHGLRPKESGILLAHQLVRAITQYALAARSPSSDCQTRVLTLDDETHLFDGQPWSSTPLPCANASAALTAAHSSQSGTRSHLGHHHPPAGRCMIPQPTAGYCDVTLATEGDCTGLGLSGSWQGGQQQLGGRVQEHFGSLAACAVFAQQRCSRARFVSYSATQDECSWFRHCEPPPLRTKFGVWETIGLGSCR